MGGYVAHGSNLQSLIKAPAGVAVVVPGPRVGICLMPGRQADRRRERLTNDEMEKDSSAAGSAC